MSGLGRRAGEEGRLVALARHPARARRRCLFPALVGLGLLCLLPSCGPRGAGGSADEVVTREAAGGDSGLRFDPLGDGYVVWESNRSGDWRIWIRQLDGSGLRQLTPEEEGRQHCCPQISPDGAHVAYLSLPQEAKEDYAKGESAGPLRLIRRDGSRDRVAVPAARTYRENRAVVWRSAERLIYIGADGTTRELDLVGHEETPLIEEPEEQYGWLVDSTLTFASKGGWPSFSPYDARTKKVLPRDDLGGCQPYFSHDGQWGFWAAGAGGPVYRMNLHTREVTTVLRKSDTRMPEGQGYLYFPMFSRSGTLFAVGASRDEHDHFQADYDIFVARSDPRTLELLDRPFRFTSHPANDRFPDVHSEPLPLGRLDGEAPFPVTLRPHREGPWEWDFGDGVTTRDEVGRHTYLTPGHYTVTARRDGAVLAGKVVVTPPTPPRVVRSSLEQAGRVVVLTFDEGIQLDEPSMRFESGRRITAWSLAPDSRSLRIQMSEEVREPDQLHLAGVSDLAHSPNLLAPVTLSVEPPLWPSRKDGLVFLWENAAALNAVYDPGLAAERVSNLAAKGRARLDHSFAMVLSGGSFVADQGSGDLVFSGCVATNEIAIELTLEPFTESQDEPGRIVSFAGKKRFNFILEQLGDRLLFSNNNRLPAMAILNLEPHQANHVVVTYRPARLVAYLNGRLVTDESLWIRNNFAGWNKRELVFGDRAEGGSDWSGRLEGVAIYNRVLEPDEVAENHLRYRKLLEARPRIPRLILEARELRRSRIPTLQEITPYREALAVFEYEVQDVLAGDLDADRIRVMHWAIQDGETLPIASGPPSRRRLVLEPLSDNPQLEGSFVSDTLPSGDTTAYFFATDADWGPSRG